MTYQYLGRVKHILIIFSDCHARHREVVLPEWIGRTTVSEICDYII